MNEDLWAQNGQRHLQMKCTRYFTKRKVPHEQR